MDWEKFELIKKSVVGYKLNKEILRPLLEQAGMSFSISKDSPGYDIVTALVDGNVYIDVNTRDIVGRGTKRPKVGESKVIFGDKEKDVYVETEPYIGINFSITTDIDKATKLLQNIL